MPLESAIASLQARERREPRNLTGFDFMRVFVQGGMPMREVPQEHWVLDGTTTAIVNCQCECGVEVQAGEYPLKCHGEDCPRSFFFDGTAVWALISPAS